jgi:hypothetical protein
VVHPAKHPIEDDEDVGFVVNDEDSSHNPPRCSHPCFSKPSAIGVVAPNRA